MIDKPSPSFEVALQEEFRRFYLAGIETGRRLEREAQGTDDNCGGYCHQAKNGEIFSCSCPCCK